MKIKKNTSSSLVLELFFQSSANCRKLKIQKIQKSASPTEQPTGYVLWFCHLCNPLFQHLWFIQVLESKPWGLSSLVDMFWGFVTFVTLFFKTLIDPDMNKKGQGYATDYRSTGNNLFSKKHFLI
jgi:hypothetical protein